MGAEAAGRAFFDGDQHFMFARQAADQVGVERLGEPRIGDGGRKAIAAQALGRQQHFGHARAEIQDGDAGAFPDDAALADFQRNAFGGPGDAGALAARIADGAGAVIDMQRRWRPYGSVPPRPTAP